MSTRGAVGIRKNNQDKLMYNHFDSYPSGLGEDMISYIKKYTNLFISDFFDNLKDLKEDEEEKLISECDDKTQDSLKRISKDFFPYSNNDEITLNRIASVLEGNLNLYAIYPEVNIFLENNNFIKDSLFCEYGYIINLDTNKLEIYIGYQKKPQKNNRYGVIKTYNNYYPCKLVKQIPLSSIRKENFSLKEKLNKLYT